jgi:hypothetical protein
MVKKENVALSTFVHKSIKLSAKRQIDLEYIKKLPRHQGKKEYIAILKGEHVSYRQRCLAHCFYCQNFYLDGAEPCLVPLCPLFGIYPYSKDRIFVDAHIEDDESYHHGAA